MKSKLFLIVSLLLMIFAPSASAIEGSPVLYWDPYYDIWPISPARECNESGPLPSAPIGGLNISSLGLQGCAPDDLTGQGTPPATVGINNSQGGDVEIGSLVSTYDTTLKVYGNREAHISYPDSGILILGDTVGYTNGKHLALDSNEIVARRTYVDGQGVPTHTGSQTLRLNDGGSGNVVINMAHNSHSTSVCRSGEILGYCSSAERFKNNIVLYSDGLAAVMDMQPVYFAWKTTGENDIGFVAEYAEDVLPELVEYDEGEVTGFNYRHYTAVLTSAVQEQQETIEMQSSLISEQADEIARLRRKVRKLSVETDRIHNALCNVGADEFCE